jgi:hypothetical protein
MGNILIPILNQSAIFVGNTARQGTPANAWACLGRRRLPQCMYNTPRHLDIIFDLEMV